MPSTTRTPEQLRRLAYYAYLDGRDARAKAMNKRADQLDRDARRAATKQTGAA